MGNFALVHFCKRDFKNFDDQEQTKFYLKKKIVALNLK